jgi:hypothetical protein
MEKLTMLKKLSNQLTVQSSAEERSSFLSHALLKNVNVVVEAGEMKAAFKDNVATAIVNL